MEHPMSTYLIAGTEMWGKFAFILFASSLVMFMIEVLHISAALASVVYGIIMGACYIMQFVTGYLTDRFLGNRKSIVLGSVIMIISTLIFTYCGSLYSLCTNTPTHSNFIFTYPEIVFIIAVFLFSVGIGFFQVSATSFVGLFYKDKEDLLDSAYTIFYMVGNIGAFFAPILLCVVVKEGHPELHQFGFLICTVVLILGLISFLALQNKYLNLENGEPVGHIPIARYLEIRTQVRPKRKLSQIEKDRVKVVLIIFMVGIVTIMSMEQTITSMVLLARDYIHGVLPLVNLKLTPQFFICLNPFFVSIFSPIYIKILGSLAKRNMEPSSVSKMTVGLVMVILGFVSILIPSYISHGEMSVIWLIFFNMFLVWGELLIMPISYSLTSKLAPVQHNSLIMGAFLAASSVGEMLAGIFASAYPILGSTTYLFGFIPITSLSAFIWAFIIFLGIILTIWVFLRNTIKKMSHGIT